MLFFLARFCLIWLGYGLTAKIIRGKGRRKKNMPCCLKKKKKNLKSLNIYSIKTKSILFYFVSYIFITGRTTFGVLSQCQAQSLNISDSLASPKNSLLPQPL